jgi:hypothetical protein
LGPPESRRNEVSSLSHRLGIETARQYAKSETASETVPEAADLKSLARRVLQRDTARDRVSRNCFAAEARSRQHFEGVSLSRFPRGETPRQPAPPSYVHIFAALEGQCPDHVVLDDWQQAIEDGRRFLAQWGEQATGLGWTAHDLFGLHKPPNKPAPNYRRLSRYGETGLIWLLRGREVVALTETTAAIKSPTSVVTVYRRHNKPALGPIGDSLDDLDPWGRDG